MTGFTSPSPEIELPYAVRIDSDGEIVWENSWEDGNMKYWKITETPDSGIAILGTHREISVIKKFDRNGELLYSWEFELGLSGHILTGFLTDGEGGYIVSGYQSTSQYYRNDFFLLNVSAEGEVEWQRIYEERRDQYCFAITDVPDGGYLLVGNTIVNNYSGQFKVIRTDEEGDIIWQNHYGAEWLEEHEYLSSDGARAVTLTEDGNIVIAGVSYLWDENIGLYLRIFMVKINLDGEIIWMNIIDRGQSEAEEPRSITNTVDGGLALTGYSEHPDGDARRFFLKTDHRGQLIWWEIRENDRVSTNISRNFGVYAHEDRTFSLIGQNSTGRGLIIRYGTDPQGVSKGEFVILPNYNGLVSAYPNPFNSMATIGFVMSTQQEVSLQLFDQSGRLVEILVDEQLGAGSFTSVWNATNQPAGVYFYRLEAGSFQQTKMLTLVK